MGYVERNLMPGEEVRYRAHLHWVVYASAIALGAAALGIAVLALRSADPAPLAVFAGLVLALAAALAFARWVKARTSEFAVTNKRVVIKVGLIRRHTLELLLTKVETIGVDQTILGRILNFGSIVVIGTGGTREAFPNIRRPLDFRKAVQGSASTGA